MALCTLVGANLLLRAFFWMTFTPILRGDTDAYVRLADRIVHWSWEGFIGDRTPGYPLLLAASGFPGMHVRYDAVVLAQFILGTAAAALVYLLLLRLTGCRWFSWVVALAHSLSLNSLEGEIYILTEPLYSFLLLLSLWLFVRRREKVILLGLLVAAMVLTRPPGIIMVPVFAAAIGFSSMAARPVGLFCAAAVCPILLWCCFLKGFCGMFGLTTITGYNLTNKVEDFFELVPDAHKDIRDAFLRYREEQMRVYGTYANTVWVHNDDLRRLLGPQATMVDLSRELMSIGLDLIRRHPVLYLGAVLRSAGRVFRPEFIVHSTDGPLSDSTSPEHGPVIKRPGWEAFLKRLWGWERPLLGAFYGAFLAGAAALALLLFRRRRVRHGVVLAAMAAMVLGNLCLTCMIEYGEPRHVLMYQPLMFVFLGGLAWQGVESWAARVRNVFVFAQGGRPTLSAWKATCSRRRRPT